MLVRTQPIQAQDAAMARDDAFGSLLREIRDLDLEPERLTELADEVALLIYRVTREFPKEEMYGLTSQMRRAAVSVP